MPVTVAAYPDFPEPPDTVFDHSPTPLTTVVLRDLSHGSDARRYFGKANPSARQELPIRRLGECARKCADILSEDFDEVLRELSKQTNLTSAGKTEQARQQTAHSVQGSKHQDQNRGVRPRQSRREVGNQQRSRTLRAHTLLPIVWANVEKGSEVHTDEYNAYNLLRLMGYTHGVVRHADKVYVDGDVHTNTIEGFWSQAKNGIRGVYHAVSAKYLQHYLDEYSFRYNHRNDVSPMFLSFLSLAILAPSQSK